MSTSEARIFLNYRRKDSEQYVFGIGLLLSSHFPGQVFWDRDAIAPGARFQTEIDNALRGSGVVIAVIGQNWLGMANEKGQRRLDDPKDTLRAELRTAIERAIPIVPV